MAGFSLGSSYAARFISKNKNKNKIKAFVSISNPFDVYKAAVELNSRKNFLYGYSATKELLKKFEFSKNTFLERISDKKLEDFDIEELLSVTTTFDYDNLLTFKLVENLQKACSKDYY